MAPTDLPDAPDVGIGEEIASEGMGEPFPDVLASPAPIAPAPPAGPIAPAAVAEAVELVRPLVGDELAEVLLADAPRTARRVRAEQRKLGSAVAPAPGPVECLVAALWIAVERAKAPTNGAKDRKNVENLPGYIRTTALDFALNGINAEATIAERKVRERVAARWAAVGAAGPGDPAWPLAERRSRELQDRFGTRGWDFRVRLGPAVQVVAVPRDESTPDCPDWREAVPKAVLTEFKALKAITVAQLRAEGKIAPAADPDREGVP